MKKILTVVTLLTILPLATQADSTKLSGRILIQAESHGEAWYVNPSDGKRYFLGRPQDAFELMKKLSIGIHNLDLNKIKPYINTQVDSDNDGYSDEVEIENGYNPFGSGKLNLDKVFTAKNLGKIFLAVEQSGQAWYLNPTDQIRYFLNRPSDAFAIMKKLGLGISNKDIETIPVGILYNEISTTTQNNATTSNKDTISAAADAIRTGDKTEAVKYFTPSMKKAIEYTIGFLNAESRLTLGNILSGSRLESATETKKTYLNEVYFNGENIPVRFYVEKIDGVWLMTNL